MSSATKGRVKGIHPSPPSGDPAVAAVGVGAAPILFVAFQAGMRADGGLKSLSLILRQLQSHRGVVATNIAGTFVDALREQGIDVYIVPELDSLAGGQRGRLGQAQRVWQSNARIHDLVKRLGATVVHCNDPQSLRSAGLGAKAAGARLVLNLRAIKADPSPSFSTLWTIPMVDRIVVLSNDMRSRLRQRIGSKVPITAIYSIVDLDTMKPVSRDERSRLRAELGLPQDRFVVGYAASFVKRKQQLPLIEIGVPLMRQVIPNFQLVLVGDAEADHAYHDACRSAAAKLPEGVVRFAGYDAHVARWMQAWDATIVASQDEGLARSMIESLSCGTPVASFDVPSASEILNEYDCGAVTALGDYSGLAEHLGRWASDASIRDALGARGRRAAEVLFRAQQVAEQYAAVWRELDQQSVSEKPLRPGSKAPHNLLPLEDLTAILACPTCRSPLRPSTAGWSCTNRSCPASLTCFSQAGRWPILVDFSSSVLRQSEVMERSGSSPITRTRVSPVKRALSRVVFPPSRQAIANTKVFVDELTRTAARPVVLVIGGAAIGAGGTRLLYESPTIQIVGIDIYSSPITQLIADAHRLPFAAGSFDGVLIQAVLEHVLEPRTVVDEIHRVLKPTGIVYAETPFMQHVHEGPYDFTRFTESGHRWLFKDFERISSGSILGAGTQLQWSLSFTARGLLRSHRAGRAVHTALFWLRYLDGAIEPRFAVDAASAVYFLGRRSEASLRPTEIIDHYQGAQRDRR